MRYSYGQWSKSAADISLDIMNRLSSHTAFYSFRHMTIATNVKLLPIFKVEIDKQTIYFMISMSFRCEKWHEYS